MLIKSTHFKKIIITDIYIYTICKILKLMTELEIINNSCGDKSIFLIGLERKIIFDFMF